MSDRTGDYDLWMTRRASLVEPWKPAQKLGQAINSNDVDACPTISPDGSILFFMSMRSGGIGGLRDLWQVTMEPAVDLNGDGIVDAADMCVIVDNWHTDNSLYDIGPPPLGDGFVDVKDLIVLAEHLFEEILLPDLIAYWKLDETEGDVAYNSIGDDHGILSGEPLWQPTNGKKGGALEFDGIDDYISTGPILNPADGTFSVFTWIKGGKPGQVVISQRDTGGETWLGTEPTNGKLITGLMAPHTGRTIPHPLQSDTIITDNHWHHIGVTWDGSYRALYVDGMEAARDATPWATLISSTGGLHIGADKDIESSSLWSGLIDSIRIYNVALSADKSVAMAN